MFSKGRHHVPFLLFFHKIYKGWGGQDQDDGDDPDDDDDDDDGDKNYRPGDDGTLRSVQFMVFLLGVKDLASASAKRLLV